MNRFKDILCIIEPDEDCKAVLERTITLAETNQANLTVAAVVPDLSTDFNILKQEFGVDLQTAIKNDKKEKLELFVKSFSYKSKIEIKVLLGVPFLEIIYDVLRHGYDLVIKTPEITDWLDNLFGSDDMHLLRKCPCPVWIMKLDSPKSYENILAAVDVDYNDDTYQAIESQKTLNHQILQIASSMAVNDFAKLHIVHTWNSQAESLMHSPFINMSKAEIDDYIDTMKYRHTKKLNVLINDAAKSQVGDMLDYLKPEIHLIKGSASQLIPKLAKKIKVDLIVMGTVARTGISGFIIGNTAETILNQINCSVLAIKPPGFVTPVRLEK